MLWTACVFLDEKKARQIFENSALYVPNLKVVTFCNVHKIQKRFPPVTINGCEGTQNAAVTVVDALRVRINNAFSSIRLLYESFMHARYKRPSNARAQKCTFFGRARTQKGCMWTASAEGASGEKFVKIIFQNSAFSLNSLISDFANDQQIHWSEIFFWIGQIHYWIHYYTPPFLTGGAVSWPND